MPISIRVILDLKSRFSTECTFLFIVHIKIGNKSFEIAEHFSYLGTTVITQN